MAISVSHLLNDTLQSLISASFPIFKSSLNLSFAQIGFITFTFQVTASLLQPAIGMLTDRKPQPYSLALGMTSTLLGLVLLSFTQSYVHLLIAVAFIGLGSAVFHPEASRVAHLAAGPRRGLAQSVFQVGGNLGASLGPLLAALVITGRSIRYNLWFVPLALIAVLLLAWVGRWYGKRIKRPHVPQHLHNEADEWRLTRRVRFLALATLLVLMFSKFFYMANMNNYYTFFLMTKFHVSIFQAQIDLFIFLFGVAAGTLAGGHLGDKLGRHFVILVSILGVSPLTLLFPYVDLMWTTILSALIGFVLASAFPTIVVYAQELFPGKIGAVSGLFFGFAFGLGGVGSAVLGMLADRTSVVFVFELCAFLPLLGLFAMTLPKKKQKDAIRKETS